MAMTILEQEVEHEEDLQALMEDLELMVSRGALRGFEGMNEALKSRIESQSLSGSS